MKALVVYDTFFGNTEQVARAIAVGLGAEAVKVDSFTPGQLAGLALLVVGSPTRGFRSSPKDQGLPEGVGRRDAERRQGGRVRHPH